MKVLIIEDEAPAARRLQKMLAEIESSINVVGCLESIEASVKWLANNVAPDLIFADIQLADGLSFEIFNTVKISSPVIFTTAYDEYALRAFKVNSIDYLLKPLDAAALKASLEKLKNTRSPSVSMEMLIQQLLPNQNYKSRFLVKSGQRLVPVGTEDIAYFYTEEKVVVMQTFSNHTYALDYTLDQLEQHLNKQEFYRINRQYIVRINSIKEINNFFNGKLKLLLNPKTETETIVSREKAAEFKLWLDQ